MSSGFLVKLGPDEYCEYSTVVDAPTSYILSHDQAVEEWGEAYIARCDETNVWSCRTDPARGNFTCGWDVIASNRAGEWVAGFEPTMVAEDDGDDPHASYNMTLDQIRQHYSAPQSQPNSSDHAAAKVAP